MRASEMAPRIERLATKPVDLSLSPDTYVVEGENQLLGNYPLTSIYI